MGDDRHRQWHFAVLVPDKFTGGIIGAFLASLAGGLAAGYLLPSPGVPSDNPPGLKKAIGDPGLADRPRSALRPRRRERRTDDASS